MMEVWDKADLGIGFYTTFSSRKVDIPRYIAHILSLSFTLQQQC